MNDHQKITAERGRRAEDLRAAAVALLEQQTIAAGVMLDLDSDQVVAAGPKSAILYLLSNSAPAATSGDAPADLQQLKALALAATPGKWEVNQASAMQNGRIVVDELYVYSPEMRNVAIASDIADPATGEMSKANADYIAAASPAVVLSLIARIERAAAPVRRVESDECAANMNGHRFGPHGRKGEIQCEWCGERAASGATASGDELPPLPTSQVYVKVWESTKEPGESLQSASQPYYTADDMHAYARAAVSAATKPTADLSNAANLVKKLRTSATAPAGWGVTYLRGLLSEAAVVVESFLAIKPAPLEEINTQQLVNDLCKIAVTNHSKSALHEHMFGAVNQFLATKPARVPEGWKLVPVEPSDNMLIAYEAWTPCSFSLYGYHAMLAAAPAAPTAAPADEVRNQALEEAALAAEKVQDEYSERQGGKWPELRDDAATGAGDCASAIRALKRPTTTQNSEAGDA